MKKESKKIIKFLGENIAMFDFELIENFIYNVRE